PGSAAPTRTPTDCCANTSPRAPTCPSTAPAGSTRSPPNSTPDPANATTGAPPPKNSTGYSQTRPHSLQRPLESKEGSTTLVQKSTLRPRSQHGARCLRPEPLGYPPGLPGQESGRDGGG